MLHKNVYLSASGQITHKNLYDSAILSFRPAQVFWPKKINFGDVVKPWREYQMTRTYSRAESKPSEFFAVKGSKKRKKLFIKLKFYC
jgi:hypothetical protein